MKTSMVTFFLCSLLFSRAEAASQCASGQAKLDLNLRFFANPNSVVFGIMDWSQTSPVNDVQVKFADTNAYRPYSTYSAYYCVPRNKLHEVYLDSTSTDGQADGKATVNANGHELMLNAAINDLFQSGLHFSDREVCPTGVSRFRLVLNFGDFPSEITWVLKKSGATVMTSSETYEVGKTAYSDIFYRSRLIVDRCFQTGNYEFTINSSNKRGLFSREGQKDFSLYVEDTLLISIPGNFGAQKVQSFNIGSSVATGIGGFACFSGEVTVQERTKGVISMKSLQLGDEILSAHNQYEKVYSFGHRHDLASAEFLQLLPSGLELTPDHMLFLEDGRAVPASTIRVGDRLASGEAVQAVKRIIRQGVYAPFTASGTFMASGEKASSYVSFQGSDVLRLGNYSTPFRFQDLAHSATLPLRLWCAYVRPCLNEHYTDEGLATWLQVPYALVRWWMQNGDSFIGFLYLLPMLIVLCALTVVNMLLENTTAALCLLLMAVVKIFSEGRIKIT